MMLGFGGPGRELLLLRLREMEQGHGLLIKAQEAVSELAGALNMEAGGAVPKIRPSCMTTCIAGWWMQM